MQSILADFPNKQFDDFLYILPVERFSINQKVRIQDLVIYPSGSVDIDELFQGHIFLDDNTRELNNLKKNTLIAFLSSSPTIYPAQAEQNFTLLNHAINYTVPVLDFIIFNYCHIHNNRTLPGRVGQVKTGETILLLSHMIYTRIICEKVNTNTITIGKGLQIKDSSFLDDYPLLESDINEAGNIVRHALRMYTQILESNSNTEKFIQIMMLFEFIASPEKYEKFKNVKTKILSHIARNASEYHKISQEFMDYSSCLRTQIIHQGKSIEGLCDKDSAIELFKNLQRYLFLCVSDLLNNYNKEWSFINEFRENKREAALKNKNKIVTYDFSSTIILIDGVFLSDSIVRYQEIYSKMYPDRELNIINLTVLCYEILLNTRSFKESKIYTFLFFYTGISKLPFVNETFNEMGGKLIANEKTEFELESFGFDSNNELFVSVNKVLDELNQDRKFSPNHSIAFEERIFEKIVFCGDNKSYQNTLAQMKEKDSKDIVLIKDSHHYSEMDVDFGLFFNVGNLVGKSLGLKHDEL